MNRAIDARLIDRARRPELARVWDELARRMSRSSQRVASIQLTDLKAEECRAIADLLGEDRLPEPTTRLRTKDIARGLRIDASLVRDLVEALRGPLPNRAQERRERKEQRAALWDWFRARVATPSLDGWIERMRSAGVLDDDVAAHRSRLEAVASVLDQLPADGVVLSVLARAATHDPHGLDWGKWTTNRVLDAVASMSALESPKNAEEARSLWDRVGVVPDEHSVAVVTLGLEPKGDDPLASSLRAMSHHAAPCSISLSQLKRWPIAAEAEQVYLFENASVLSFAATTAWRGPPLLCTAGWPNTAVFVLCRQLLNSGARLFHHGDFDPTGIEITRYLMERASVCPWRMDASDYVALADHSQTSFEGPVIETPWDPALAEAMRVRKKIAYEEDVVAGLLSELLAPQHCRA